MCHETFYREYLIHKGDSRVHLRCVIEPRSQKEVDHWLVVSMAVSEYSESVSLRELAY